jgi:S-adenosylmethionine:tRNA ribosyltransferase-isomerase
MKLDAFDYDLPDGRIATTPARPREAAKLLDMTSAGGLVDRHMYDLPDLCQPGDVIVVNNTSVIPARLIGYRGAAKISITLHKSELSGDQSQTPGFGSHWRVFAKPAKKCRTDDIIVFGDDFAAHVLGRGDGGDVAVCFINPEKNHAPVAGPELENCLTRYGTMPLPPYIARPDGATTADESDYQTMFAQHPGAVAAPTAGLHFTPALAAQLTAKNVSIVEITLHVGAGTFLPVTVDNIADHKMHAEWGAISSDTASVIRAAQQSGRRIIAVGTTSLRILEACFQQHGSIQAFAGETDIFITPGFEFGVVDALLTNFHLPKSTLLMLISAFCGMRHVRDAYQYAIAGEYRFFSYGDACFMQRAAQPDSVTSLRYHSREKRV